MAEIFIIGALESYAPHFCAGTIFGATTTLFALHADEFNVIKASVVTTAFAAPSIAYAVYTGEYSEALFGFCRALPVGVALGVAVLKSLDEDKKKLKAFEKLKAAMYTNERRVEAQKEAEEAEEAEPEDEEEAEPEPEDEEEAEPETEEDDDQEQYSRDYDPDYFPEEVGGEE